MSDKRCIIESMKKGIKENPTLKKYLDKMVSDGIDEDTALDIMILVWFQYGIKKEEVDKVICDE